MKKNRQPVSPAGRKWGRSLLLINLKLLLVFISSNPLSGAVHAQDSRLSVSMQGVSLEELIWDLQKKTDLIFMYGDKDIEGVQGLNIDLRDKTVEEILTFCLKNTGLTYQLSGNAVIIRKAAAQQPAPRITVTGSVRDESGDIIPGATIIVKGTNSGVATGVDGQYTIELTRGSDVILIASFLGKQTKEVRWSGQARVDITLAEAVLEVGEVVITGYNTVNRADMVGTYKQIKAEDIMMPVYTSVDQMLQGEVAGLMVYNTSSRVGASPTIKMRGTGTILGNQSPLWVVDGIIQEDPLEMDLTTYLDGELAEIMGSQISWLNPHDIETITILKDASAVAVYGSKASNGVIVVTTKKNRTGKVSVSYSGNVSVNTRPNYNQFNLMNSKERVMFSEEAFAGGAFYQKEPIKQPYTYEGVMQMYLADDISLDEYFNMRERLETMNTDWFKLLTRTAVSHNHNVNLSGGTNKMNYTASIGYANTLGQEKGNDSEKMTGRISLTANLTDKVRVDMTLHGTTTTTNSFGYSVNPMSYATNTSRAVPAYDENGDPVYYRVEASYRYNNTVKDLGYNFINERDNSLSRVENTHLSASLNLNWRILDWLTYQFTGGYSKNLNTNESYFTEYTFRVANQYRGYNYGEAEPGSTLFNAAILPFGGELLTSDGNTTSYNIQNKVLFSKQFNNDHRLNAMIAMEIRSNHIRSTTNTVWGYVPDRGKKLMRPADYNSFSPIGVAKPGLHIFDALYSGSWKKADRTDNYVSLFSTVAYSFKNRYTANIVFRNDYSNRFGQDVNNRFDPNYSFGFAWQLSEESFMEPVSNVFPYFRLKATFGILGNVVNSVSPDLILYQGGIANLYNTYQSSILSLPNPNLKWESTHTWDFGMEMNLLGVLDIEANYYTKRSNAIINQGLSDEYGKETMSFNGGILHNRGVELTVSLTPINTQDWSFNLSVNSSKNWNKAGKALFTPKTIDFTTGSPSQILKKGYALGGFWSYSFAGLSPEDGRPMFNYMDLERDSNIDPTNFLVYSGTVEPDFTGGINFSLRYKSLRLSSGMALLIGGKKRLPNPYASFIYNKIPDPTINLSRDLNNRWKKPGDERYTNIPALVNQMISEIVLPDNSSVSWLQMWANSDERVANASFLRCKQISLSWTVPQSLTRKVGVSNCSLSATVNNIFVIGSKRFNGFDPELGDSVYPKHFSIGLNISL